MNTLPMILGLSGGEIAFILFIAVMVFGAEKIPEVARGLGKGIRSIKDATTEIKDEVMKSSEKTDLNSEGMKNVKQEYDKVKEDIKEITGSVKRRF